jgi:hypothetical protein
VAEIWEALAESGPFLRHVIEHNIIWKDTEKDWFDGLKHERQVVWYIIELMGPKEIRQHPRIKGVAEKYDFLTVHRL